MEMVWLYFSFYSRVEKGVYVSCRNIQMGSPYSLAAENADDLFRLRMPVLLNS